jgi:glucose-6-phosphate dehydrogenase assembly protein OpcA
LYSYAGNILGFEGYYNPFSGEGQVNTTVPVFEQPFVACHEIGHQVGYAKENEANFAGFLACRLHTSPVFRYSVYFDMYNYSINELYRNDSSRARQYIDSTRLNQSLPGSTENIYRQTISQVGEEPTAK